MDNGFLLCFSNFLNNNLFGSLRCNTTKTRGSNIFLCLKYAGLPRIRIIEVVIGFLASTSSIIHIFYMQFYCSAIDSKTSATGIPRRLQPGLTPMAHSFECHSGELYRRLPNANSSNKRFSRCGIKLHGYFNCVDSLVIGTDVC